MIDDIVIDGDHTEDWQCQDQTEGSEVLFAAVRYGP